jgi:hypothetical protein
MRVPIVALAACALSACATTADPAAPTPPAGGHVTDGNDCAVIAAVAREHYRFNTTDNVPPPLWLDAEGTDWAPRCDWSRYGLAFPTTHDPDRPHQPGQRVRWVSFKQPRYDGSGAIIETGILHGPLAGIGNECRIRSGFAGWTVDECRSTWIS